MPKLTLTLTLEPEHRKVLETYQERLQRRFDIGKVTQADALRKALSFAFKNDTDSK